MKYNLSKRTQITLVSWGIVSLFVSSSLMGCSETNYFTNRLNSQETLCTPAASYHQGFEDGRRALGMQSNFADTCPSNNIAIQSAYRDGYIAGQSEQH